MFYKLNKNLKLTNGQYYKYKINMYVQYLNMSIIN